MNEHNHEEKGGCCGGSESKGHGCCGGKGILIKALVAVLLVGLGFCLAKGPCSLNKAPQSAPVQMQQ